jgi:V8-like Glu-specific endopeptidase
MLGVNYLQIQEDLGIVGYQQTEEKTLEKMGVWKRGAHQTELPIIRHQIATLSGSNGSPLLVRRDEKIIAVGIHSGAINELGSSQARAITKDVLSNLLIWEKYMA